MKYFVYIMQKVNESQDYVNKSIIGNIPWWVFCLVIFHSKNNFNINIVVQHQK